MKMIKSAIVVLAVVFIAASAVYAQTQGECKQAGEGRKGRMLQELNLTLEQQKQLEENRQAQRQELMKLHTAIRQKQEQLQQALKGPAVTEGSVAPLVNQIKSLQGQLIDLRVKGILAVKGILTAEQFAKFQEKTQNWQEKRKGHFQYRRQRRNASPGNGNKEPAI